MALFYTKKRVSKKAPSSFYIKVEVFPILMNSFFNLWLMKLIAGLESVDIVL